MPESMNICSLKLDYCSTLCNFHHMQAVITLAELEIPDQLRHGPKTAKQLAFDLNLHQDYLARLLRLADRMGFIATKTNNGVKQYELTSISAVLCEDHVNSVKHLVRLFGDQWPAFHHLPEGIRSGKTPYTLYAKGASHWQHMKEVPELYTRFNKWVTDLEVSRNIRHVLGCILSFEPW